MTWKQLTEKDCREWKLSAIDPQDRDTWRSGVRSAMRVASQLPRRGAHCCGYCPCTCTLINKRTIVVLYRSPETLLPIIWEWRPTDFQIITFLAKFCTTII